MRYDIGCLSSVNDIGVGEESQAVLNVIYQGAEMGVILSETTHCLQ